MPRLKRVDTSEPGIARLRRGRGFTYVDPAGRRLTDSREIERIRQLAIPAHCRTAISRRSARTPPDESSTSITRRGESDGTRPSSSA